MDNSDSKTKSSIIRIVTNYLYSQIGCIFAIGSTNVLEVLKVKRIMDSYTCNPHHFQSKNYFSYLPQRMKIPSNLSGLHANSTTNCSECLPQGNFLIQYRFLIQKYGLRQTIFNGMYNSIAANLVKFGLFFTLREELIKAFKSSRFAFLRNHESFSSILSSTIARTISTIISFPLDLKKIDSQLNQSLELKSTKVKFSQFRIYLPTMFQFYQKEMFNTLFFWVLYEIFRKHFSRDQTRSESRINILSATAAGGISAFLSHPYDYFQTITNSLRHQSLGNTKMLGFWQIFQFYRTNNVLPHILSGITLRSSRGFIANIIFFTIFETNKSQK